MAALPISALRYRSSVLQNQTIAPGAFELEMTRGGFLYRPGDEIVIHGRSQPEDRTYSVVSGENDPTIKLLIRIIPEGITSPLLALLKPKDTVEFTGPTGSFQLREPDRPLWFIATGTGIAPLLSFLRTHPNMRPTVLHGVRTGEELYYRDEVEQRSAAYYPCLSREGEHPQRVTDALKELAPPADADIYLCGGQPMINSVRTILLEKNIASDRIITEPYFFW
ncbi:MAG: FAD-dependent oxidoreductase [Kiritimatiellae bacterium]|nr:FAD-dependent oxidoreductase [Kiritimatiellia bacterium]